MRNGKSEKQPHVRALPWIIVYAIALAAAVIAFFVLRDDSGPEIFGSLDTRFGSDIKFEYNGQSLEYRGNELTNVLFFVTDEEDSQAEFMFLLCADRRERKTTIFYIDQDLPGADDVEAVSHLLGGIPVAGQVTVDAVDLAEAVRGADDLSQIDLNAFLQTAQITTDLSQHAISDYMTSWSKYRQGPVIRTSNADALGAMIAETFFE